MSEADLATTLLHLARGLADEVEPDARKLAARSIRKLGGATLRELATRDLATWIERLRRAKVRTVERGAEQTVSASRPVVAQPQRGKAVSGIPGREQWLADPSLLDWGREKSDGGQPTKMLNAPERRMFVAWLGDRYDDWYERGRRSVEAAEARGEYGLRNGEQHYFLGDYYERARPGASRDYFARLRQRAVLDLIDETAQQVRLETTVELLSSVFALGDGTETTWGAATVAQHEQRLQMLAKNASGVVETAALHRKAIEMIRAAGVSCLAEVSSPSMEVAA